jgi:hypothetical protein
MIDPLDKVVLIRRAHRARVSSSEERTAGEPVRSCGRSHPEPDPKGRARERCVEPFQARTPRRGHEAKSAQNTEGHLGNPGRPLRTTPTMETVRRTARGRLPPGYLRADRAQAPRGRQSCGCYRSRDRRDRQRTSGRSSSLSSPNASHWRRRRHRWVDPIHAKAVPRTRDTEGRCAGAPRLPSSCLVGRESRGMSTSGVS